MSRQYQVINVGQALRRISRINHQGGTYAGAGKTIVEVLRGRAKAAILETEYVDRDYSAAYAALYGRSFRPPSRSTERIHFFDRSTTLDELKGDRRVIGYLGFVVIWPTNPQVIGRSVLVPPVRRGDRLIPLTTTVHLAGHELLVRGVPYATKDFGVSACATVATWLATEIMSQQFGLPRTSSSEVTLSATRHSHTFGRSLPQHYGLSVGEMSHALAEVGYSPFVYDLDNFHWRAAGTVYGYVESGIPAILQCEMQDGSFHALLAVGVEFDSGRIPTAGSFRDGVRALIVHDDRSGPYGRLTIVQEPAKSVAGRMYCDLTFEGTTQPERVAVLAILVPLPNGVHTISTRAHVKGRDWLALAYKSETGIGLPGQSLAFRTRLWDSVGLKRASFSWQQQGAAADLRETALPHWVWVTEAYEGTSFLEPQGRYVSDASMLSGDAKGRRLWGHIESRVFLARP